MYLSQRMTSYQIADKFRVDRVSAVRWLNRYGITLRAANDGLENRGVTPPTKEELERMVHAEHLSYKEVAAKFGVDFTAVPHWLKKHGVTRPEGCLAFRKRGVALPDADVLQSMYGEGLSTRLIALHFNVSSATIKALLKQYDIEARPSGFNGGKRLTCDDGTIVKSVYEQRVANWLVANALAFEYEPKLPFSNSLKGDFLVNGWFIEVWGVEGSARYDARRERKVSLYATHELPLIELLPRHLYTAALGRRLAKCRLSPSGENRSQG